VESEYIGRSWGQHLSSIALFVLDRLVRDFKWGQVLYCFVILGGLIGLTVNDCEGFRMLPHPDKSFWSVG
jgi:hypothetical protein